MILGCVADDFTGASDAASFLQAGGANVILSNGIPEREDEDILAVENHTISSSIQVMALPLYLIIFTKVIKQKLLHS